MATDKRYKHIEITPNKGTANYPSITLSGNMDVANGVPDMISLEVMDDGTLSFNANNTGEIFSISPDNSESYFAVSDLSGASVIDISADTWSTTPMIALVAGSGTTAFSGKTGGRVTIGYPSANADFEDISPDALLFTKGIAARGFRSDNNPISTGFLKADGDVDTTNYSTEDTWLPNTRTQDGYVTAPGSTPNLAWGTDSLGNPAWRAIATGGQLDYYFTDGLQVSNTATDSTISVYFPNISVKSDATGLDLLYLVPSTGQVYTVDPSIVKLSTFNNDLGNYGNFLQYDDTVNPITKDSTVTITGSNLLVDDQEVWHEGNLDIAAIIASQDPNQVVVEGETNFGLNELVTSASFSSYSSNAASGVFADNGNLYFVLDLGGTGVLYKFSLSTPYDIGTASPLPLQSVAMPDGYDWLIAITPTAVIATGVFGATRQFPMTSYDLTTLSSTEVFSSVAGDMTGFSEDGLEYYAFNDSDNTLYQYNMTTAYDLTTAVPPTTTVMSDSTAFNSQIIYTYNARGFIGLGGKFIAGRDPISGAIGAKYTSVPVDHTSTITDQGVFNGYPNTSYRSISYYTDGVNGYFVVVYNATHYVFKVPGGLKLNTTTIGSSGPAATSSDVTGIAVALNWD